MNHEYLKDVIAGMIAAGGVDYLPARTPWPLHKTLGELAQEAGRLGLVSKLGGPIAFAPSPEVGRRAAGADMALRELVTDGLLLESGTGLDARLVVDPQRLIGERRRLLALDAEVVRLVQRAGERWAALAATCSKYAEAAPMSPGAIVMSGAA